MRSPRRWVIGKLCTRRGHELDYLKREARFRLPDGRVVRVSMRCACGSRRVLEEIK